MVIIFIRSLTTFIVLLIVMRLMGKRQIGEMQPFELVITLLIAELACIPMADISVPLVYGIAAILAVFILHQLLSVIEQTSQTAKRIISGKPSLVLNKNGVDFTELKRNNMELSAKEKVDYDKRKTSLPVLLIGEGKLICKNLSIIGRDKPWLEELLRKNGIKRIKGVGVMTVDGNGKVYLQKENEKYKTFATEIGRNVKW